MANNNNKTLSEKVVAVAHVIFFLEGVLSFTTGLMLMFCPSWVMEQQGFDWRNPLAADNLAQFGAVVVLMGYMGLRAPVHPRVIEALLLGDLLWVYVFARMLCTHLWDATVRWTLAAHFSLWITVFLAVARTLYLLCYQEQRHPHPQQASMTETTNTTKHNNNDQQREDKEGEAGSTAQQLEEGREAMAFSSLLQVGDCSLLPFCIFLDLMGVVHVFF